MMHQYFSNQQLAMAAKSLRALSVAMVERAGSGHPGLPLGMADVTACLFFNHLHCNPKQPTWLARDKFILSAGHGSALLYSLLYLMGYQDMPITALQNFRQLHSPAAGHPEYGLARGIETTTGPLGQGLANAIGMAIAQKKLAARYGPGFDSKIYVLVGDGCLMEGIGAEALDLAGHLRLDNLIILFDDNHISIDGDTALATNLDQQARLRLHGFHSLSIDGHELDAIHSAMLEAKGFDRPSFIGCRTVIGRGAPKKQGTAAAHGAPLGNDEISAVLTGLDLTKSQQSALLADLTLPMEWLQPWQELQLQQQQHYQTWQKNYGAIKVSLAPVATELKHLLSPNSQSDSSKELAHLATQWQQQNKPIASRVASLQVLTLLNKYLGDYLVGGSADLTGSNGTKTPDQTIFSSNNWLGQYIHYGVREHAMAAVMNGLALSGVVIPYGGTFLVFSDYMRAAMRLSALMRQRVIYVLTHDSIGLGEDGPTHQPIEQLTALRAIPQLLVLRPADGIEVIEAWQIALTCEWPVVLALSRQALPFLKRAEMTINSEPSVDNLPSKLGAYIVTTMGKEHHPERQLTLMASGSEVGLISAAAEILGKEYHVVLVSMPCMELFRQQSQSYQQAILGLAPRLAVEAGLAMSWHEWLRQDLADSHANKDEFLGLNSFGDSAPYEQIYQARGLTVEAIVGKAKNLLKK